MGNSNGVPENMGFQVVEIMSKGPGEKAGLLVNTDFILTVNGKKLRKLTPEQIKSLIQVNEDKESKLQVYNSATGQKRELTLVPTKNWPGSGLLGLRIRLALYDTPNVESDIPDSEFGWDDIYAQEEDSTIPYTTRSRQEEVPKLTSSNSFMGSLGNLTSFGKSGKS